MSQPGQQSTASTPLPVPPPAPIMVGNNGTPGGYKFDPDQVQGVINQWKQLRDDLNGDLQNVRAIANVTAPAGDPASGQFMQGGANPSGRTLLDQHHRMLQYVQNYIDALEKASGQIQQAEDDAHEAVNQSGGPAL